MSEEILISDLKYQELDKERLLSVDWISLLEFISVHYNFFSASDHLKHLILV